MFCCALLCVHSSFAIISMGKKELFFLHCLSSWWPVIVVYLFFTMSQVCLPFVIVFLRSYSLTVAKRSHVAYQIKGNVA